MVSFPDHILCSLSESSLGMRLVTMLVGACEHSAVCKTLLSSTHSNMKQYIHVHLVLDFFFFIPQTFSALQESLADNNFTAPRDFTFNSGDNPQGQVMNLAVR